MGTTVKSMNNKKTVSNVLNGTIGAMAVFFVLGLADNIKSPTISPLLKELNFNYTNGGTIFLGTYFGFLIAVTFVGLIIKKIGNKWAITIGMLMLLSGLIFYSHSTTLLMLTVSMVIIGSSFGIFEVSGSAFIVELHDENEKRGKFLLLLGFFHSVGAMIAPLIAGQLINNKVSWQNVYRLTAVIVLIIFIYFLLLKHEKPVAKSTTIGKNKQISKMIFSKNMIYFYILILSYVGFETSMGLWIVEYLQKFKELDIALSTMSVSVFFGCIMLGRFAGCFIVDKIGCIKIMRIGVIFSMISLGIGLFGSNELFFFIPLTGLFLSVIFPATTMAISKISENDLSIKLGVLFAFAGIGGMLGPWGLGLIGDIADMNMSFSVVTMSLSVLMLFSLTNIENLPEFSNEKFNLTDSQIEGRFKYSRFNTPNMDSFNKSMQIFSKNFIRIKDNVKFQTIMLNKLRGIHKILLCLTIIYLVALLVILFKGSNNVQKNNISVSVPKHTIGTVKK